jgi:hypothetical protein
MYTTLTESFQQITDIDYLVVGTGGAGNTSFIRYLTDKGLKTNHTGNKDGHKHLYNPSLVKRLPRTKKAIYIYGEPVRTIYSHYRRWKNPNSHFKHFNVYYKHPNNYEQYIKDVDEYGFDISGLDRHTHNWTKGDPRFSILLVDFTKLDEKDTKKTISRYMGLGDDFFADLKFDKHRYYKHDHYLNGVQTVNYKDIYGKVYEKLKPFHLKIV